MMLPTYLDSLIESVLDTGDANKIAERIFTDEKVLAAIKEGVEEANKPVPPHVYGSSPAQKVRGALMSVLESPDNNWKP